jgi:hypothetical protein
MLVVAYQFIPPGSTDPTFGVTEPISVDHVSTDPTADAHSVTLETKIPMGSSGIKYFLVFKGALGQENGAVAASRIDLCTGFCEDWEEGTGCRAASGSLSGDSGTSGSTVFQSANGY